MSLQRLVMLRILRPDRVVRAMARYCSQNLSIDTHEPVTLQQVLNRVTDKHPAILLLMENEDTSPLATMRHSPAQLVSSVAEVRAIRQACVRVPVLKEFGSEIVKLADTTLFRAVEETWNFVGNCGGGS